MVKWLLWDKKHYEVLGEETAQPIEEREEVIRAGVVPEKVKPLAITGGTFGLLYVIERKIGG